MEIKKHQKYSHKPGPHSCLGQCSQKSGLQDGRFTLIYVTFFNTFASLYEFIH